ncbi:MAG: hypothetical protein WC683_02235 [bacterium]
MGNGIFDGPAEETISIPTEDMPGSAEERRATIILDEFDIMRTIGKLDRRTRHRLSAWLQASEAFDAVVFPCPCETEERRYGAAAEEPAKESHRDNPVDERHALLQWLPDTVKAVVFVNFCDHEIRLLLDGPLDEEGAVRRALMIVEPKDDDGIPYQAPMSIVPLHGYVHFPQQIGAWVSVVIGTKLYKMEWIETIEPSQLSEHWGETVAARARKDVPCPCFRIELEDDSKDFSQLVFLRHKQLRRMFEGKNPFEKDEELVAEASPEEPAKA